MLCSLPEISKPIKAIYAHSASNLAFDPPYPFIDLLERQFCYTYGRTLSEQEVSHLRFAPIVEIIPFFSPILLIMFTTLSFPPCNFMLSYRSVMSLPSYDPERQSLHNTAKHPPLSHSSTSWIVNVLHRHRPAETQPHRDINNNNPNVNQLWPRADHRDVQWSRDGMHEEGGVQLHAYTVPRLGTWGPTVRPEPASLSFLMGRYCCLQADAGLAKRARKTFKLSSRSTHATHMPVLDHARLQGDRDTRSGPGWWNVRPQQPYESTLSRVAVCHRAKLSRRDSFAALRCPTLEDKPAFHGYWWSPVA
ncbi:hypothetical protein CCHR01_12671 [Colletotrichum chrysophilum]|uniref:Uncharacterized protein n=1 Tax=Colletotrichum chrysophilum TaxID=1836956 RepID=A0AAD9AAU3_9PEZI|nr:hypothetical protein CCHR01_12671 [Colletotrichum chrysophilum]